MLRYYITDRRGCPDVLGCIERAARDGVDYVQIREKDLSSRELFELTKRSVEIVRKWTTRVLVNGRVDIALAASADGVHLPSAAIAPETWRRILPPGFLIAVSCHSIRDVEHSGMADFAVFGPVFASPGKSGAVGLDALRKAVLASPVPVLALGGVDESNAQACVSAGASGIAAIRMFQQSP